MMSMMRHAIEGDHHLKGARVEKIADQHAGGVAEHFVGGIAAAPQRGAVDHVVVQQGGGVNELDDGCRLDVLFAPVSAGARRQQHQKRAQALASGIDDVGGHLVDQAHLAVQTPLDDPVDGLKVGSYQRRESVLVSWGAQSNAPWYLRNMRAAGGRRGPGPLT